MNLKNQSGYGERLSGEGAKPFLFFLEYCDMGFSRSIAKLAQMEIEGQSVSRRVLYNWCRKFNWKERARVYDSVMAAHRVEARVKGQANPSPPPKTEPTFFDLIYGRAARNGACAPE